MLVDTSFKIVRKLMRLGQSKSLYKPLVASLSGALTRVSFIQEDQLHRTIVTAIKGSCSHTLEYYKNEVLQNDLLSKTYFTRAAEFGSKKYSNWEDRVNRVIGGICIYYGIVRELKPQVIVETGTATGSMTSFLLAALHENKQGKLISIDLPPVEGKLTMDITVPRESVGLYIPEQYRDRWTYMPGDAKVLLPQVMVKENVDMFIHDSLHTTTHMAFEYAVARALMRENTLIASDDILWNRSFFDFLDTHDLQGYAPSTNPNIGVCINKFDEFEKNEGLGVQEFWRG